MANQERIDGPTPSGGAYFVAYYLLAGEPADKASAEAVEIVEYDAADQQIARTYGRMPARHAPNP